MESLGKHWDGQARKVVESPFLEVENISMWRLVDMVVFSQRLYLMILEVFSDLGDSVALRGLQATRGTVQAALVIRIFLWGFLFLPPCVADKCFQCVDFLMQALMLC